MMSNRLQVGCAFLLTVLIYLAVPANEASAQTITCTGTETPTTDSQVFFDFSAGTCVIFETGATVRQNDLMFSAAIIVAESFVGGTSNTTNDNTAHAGCSIGNFSAAAGVACSSQRTTNGNETGTATVNATDGSVIVMSVSYTIAGGGTSIDITSASVSITSASTNTESAVQALQASVSRSQSAVVGNNIGSRVASASSAPGNDKEREQSSTGFAQRLGFTVGEDGSVEPQSRGGSVRDLAMLASFDNSTMVLSASESDQDPTRAPGQRQNFIADSSFTIWGHGSFTSVGNDRNNTGDDQRFDGDVWGYNIGADYRHSSRLVAGMSLGYSETDLTTAFNSGTYEETNWTLSPYAIIQPADGVTLSLIGGYSIGKVDRTRDTTITGEADSDMWFASVNASHLYQPSADVPLDLTARLGFLISRKTTDSFTESDSTAVAEATSDTRQLKPGVEAAYSFVVQSNVIQPFVKTDYVHDFTDETNGDSGAFSVGGGFRLASGGTGLSGSIEGESQLGRDDYSEYSFSGLVAYSFGVSNDGAQLGIAAPYFSSTFNPDSGPSFGTGLNFTSGEALSVGIDVTHSLPVSRTSSTAAQARASLKF